MKITDWISTISAAIALASLIATIIFARRAAASNKEAGERAGEANQYASRANDIAMGQAENDLRAAITSARARYEDVCADLEAIIDGRRPDELTAQDKRRLMPLKRRQDSAMEDLLNTYQNACNKYVDDRIDRERFKKDYFTEIRGLFEPATNPFHNLLHPEGVSRYKALWKVYKDWYDLENRPSQGRG